MTDVPPPAVEPPPASSGYQGPVQPEGTQTPTTILLFGILGFVFGPLGGLGWWYGKKYMDACRDEGLTPDGNAVAGYYCGMISFLIFAVAMGMVLVMMLVWFVFFVIFMLFYVLIIFIALIASL